MSEELTKEQAIQLAASGFWKSMTHREIAEFQLFTDRLCVPASVFHEAVEKTLNRPVWTHEFMSTDGLERLRAELRGEKGKPTFAEICALIPADKRLLVVP